MRKMVYIYIYIFFIIIIIIIIYLYLCEDLDCLQFQGIQP